MRKILVFSCLSILACCTRPAIAQSDLYISKGYTQGCGFNGSRRPFIEYRWVTQAQHDAMHEGHQLPVGINRLVRLGTLLTNMGPNAADFGVTDSANNFIFHPEHSHWHYMGPDGRGFLFFDLNDCQSNTVASGNKIGYQIINDIRFFPSACELSYMAPYGGFPDWLRTTPENPLFGPNHAGIDPGYADPYSAGTFENWIPVNNVANGHYTLHVYLNVPSWINQGFNSYPDDFQIPIYINDPYSINNPPPLAPGGSLIIEGAILLGTEIPAIPAPAPVTNAAADARTVTFTESSGACSYLIQRQVWEMGGWVNNSENGGFQEVSGSPFIDVNAAAKRTYRWTIIAKNAGGASIMVYTNKTRVNR